MSHLRFSSQINHSRQEQIHSIVDSLDSLASSENLTPQQRSHLRKIREQCEALAQHIRDDSFTIPQSDELMLLTEAEKRVLKRLVKGELTREISRQLYISEATVKTHLTSIYLKLNCRNRAEAIQKALLSGF